MGPFAILFWIAVGLVALVVVLGIIGGILKKRAAARGEAVQDDTFLTDKTVENVNDLNDRFNRARYMDRDGS